MTTREAVYHTRGPRGNHWADQPCHVTWSGDTCPRERALIHDSRTRTATHRVWDQDGKRLGKARLQALVDAVVTPAMQREARIHGLLYVRSRGQTMEALRVGSDHGTPIIKVRGCWAWRKVVTDALKDAALDRGWTFR